MSISIFVTDDEPAVRLAITKRLIRQHYHVRNFDSVEALLTELEQEGPDIILLDLKMPGMSGLEALKHIRATAPHTLVILLTAYGTVEDAVEAMKMGAYDFLIKNIDLSVMEPVIRRAVEFLTLRRRINHETEDSASRFAFPNLIVHSPKMRELIRQIHDLAQTPKTTVLIQGETGTGKEFLARVLHHNSARGRFPFVGVNCTAIPRDLFESEFFGYERGAFTGANQRKPGLCEQAEGGTLFLDEIGDLDPTMQVKLLRVLEERTIKRLGGQTEIHVDFRLIAATNRELRREILQGTFREDLFFRLNVVSLELPPLRQRVEDIMPLGRAVLLRYGQEFGKDVTEICSEAQTLLEQYAFPGNIRELHNIVERALIFCQGKTITPGDLPLELKMQTRIATAALSRTEEQLIRIEMILGRDSLADVEFAILNQAMRAAGNNKSLAAQHVGLTRFALDRRLKKKPSGGKSARVFD